MNRAIFDNILLITGASNLEAWGNEQRFDPDLHKKLSCVENISHEVADIEDAKQLFWLFLGREGGEERAGRPFTDIINELHSSEEYQINHFKHRIQNRQEIRIAQAGGEVVVKHGDQVAQDQGVFSCILEYSNNSIIATLPRNACSRTAAARFRPYINILFKTLSILAGTKSRNREAIFFYGDHPTRESGIAFCSNKSTDYLIPDPDSIPIFKEPNQKVLPWNSRKEKAYFRGTDTGAQLYAYATSSQRVVAADISLRNPDLVDAKLTGVQDKSFEDIYRSMGIYGDKEPQSNIQIYKYNLDIDGNSNSWNGLVIKLKNGAGGVVLKVESQEDYRQWFYNRLEPWVNYVPVKGDLSDLLDKIEFLRKNDTLAENIHKNAVRIFHGIDYEYLQDYTANVFAKAIMGIK